MTETLLFTLESWVSGCRHGFPCEVWTSGRSGDVEQRPGGRVSVVGLRAIPTCGCTSMFGSDVLRGRFFPIFAVFDNLPWI